MDVSASAPQQSSQYAARPQFNKVIATEFHQALDTIEPAHRARNLVLKRATNFYRSPHFGTGNVADDRKTQRLHRNVLKRRAKLFISAFHQTRMMRARHVESCRATNSG